jgi:hypothetical protein
LVYDVLLIRLNAPFLIDNYLQVSSSRQPKKNNNNKKSGEICDSFGHREQRDSHRERDLRCDHQQGTSRVYTPAQFENSLGKLQVYSIERLSFEIKLLFGENNRKGSGELTE